MTELFRGKDADNQITGGFGASKGEQLFNEIINRALADDLANTIAAATGLGQPPRPTFNPNIPTSQDIFNKPLSELVNTANTNGLPQETINNLIDAKDTQFSNEINALGGMTKDNIGEVIAITEKIYGEGDDRGKVAFLTEALKDGVTTQDIADSTGLSVQEVFNAGAQAVETAIQKPVDALTGIIKTGIELVEKGAEVTGVEKVINVIGNATARAVGLDPNKTTKNVVINPVTGQVVSQASNQPGGGILGNLPQSPYIRTGTTSGGTSYGVDVENAVANVILGQIATQGTLDSSSLPGIVGAAIEDATGIPTETAAGIVNDAIEAVGTIGNVVTGSTIVDENAGSTNVSVVAGGGDDDDDDVTPGYTVINGAGGDTNVITTGGTGNEVDTESTASVITTDNDSNNTNVTTTSDGGNTNVTDITDVTNIYNCPAGSTYNETTKQCEKVTDFTSATNIYNCPTGSTYNETTKQCEKVTNLTDVTTIINCPEGSTKNELGQCISETTGTVINRTVCPEGSSLDASGQCISEITGTVVNKTVCADGSEPDENGNCINEITGSVVDKTVCPEGSSLDASGQCINEITGTVVNKTVCADGSEPVNGQCINETFGEVINRTVCEQGVYDEALGKCVNTLTGEVITNTVCADGSDPDADGNCFTTVPGNVITNTVCPEGTDGPDADGNCISTITGEVVEKIECPAGMSFNSTTKQCEYTKIYCGEGYQLNPFTGQCEEITDDEEVAVASDVLPTRTGGIPGAAEFVTRDDVLVEFDKPDYTPYSILPAPATDPYLAGRRQSDIESSLDVLGFNLGQGLDQSPEAMERVARYANRFGIGQQDAPLADIAGFEEKFDIDLPDVSTNFPVAPTEPISQPRYNPLTFGQEPDAPPAAQPEGPLDLPSNAMSMSDMYARYAEAPPQYDEDGNRLVISPPPMFARGGVAESNDGIGSLMERRAGAVNRMLLNKAGMNFGQR